jgi:ParB-like chromosome segregation protein Spo0J
MQYIDIDILKPHKANPRKLKARELEKLCASLQANPEYFEARPIICDSKHVIWAGNSRYKAAQKLGMKQVPVHIMDLPEAKMREIMIRDNVSNGEWDMDMLAEEWSFDELTLGGLELQSDWEASAGEQVDDKLARKAKTKTMKTVQCPHCQETFEI